MVGGPGEFWASDVYVMALRCDLRFPQAQSLKEKRGVLRPIVDGARSRFDVSVAETNHQDTWQRCELGFALVSGDPKSVEELADRIERFIWGAAGVEVLEIDRTWVELA